MRTSDEVNELYQALAKAQSGIKPATKDADNPHFKFKYASLDSCWQAIRQPLSGNGLALIQAPGNEDGKITLTTRLAHTSGQWIETTMAIEPDKNTVQAMGSAITYLRRYSLALIGLTSDEDDDGQAAGEAQPARTNGKQPTGHTATELLQKLNRVVGIEDYYKHTEHLYNSLSKEIPGFNWPTPNDTESWKETFVIARDRAKAQIETQPAIPTLFENEEDLDEIGHPRHPSNYGDK